MSATLAAWFASFARMLTSGRGRVPALIGGAFFPAAGEAIPPSFYMFALVVVLANLWMLARAGWDL